MMLKPEFVAGAWAPWADLDVLDQASAEFVEAEKTWVRARVLVRSGMLRQRSRDDLLHVVGFDKVRGVAELQ